MACKVLIGSTQSQPILYFYFCVSDSIQVNIKWYKNANKPPSIDEHLHSGSFYICTNGCRYTCSLREIPFPFVYMSGSATNNKARHCCLYDLLGKNVFLWECWCCLMYFTFKVSLLTLLKNSTSCLLLSYSKLVKSANVVRLYWLENNICG